jgi:16S rRNA (guanine527-N7)-methyltransferase
MAIAELEIYEALLRRWQEKINLVADQSLPWIWSRHFADSAQVFEARPTISTWADLGSGAGFPGMVIALLLKARPGAAVHLIESDQRKAAFLRAVSRETQAPTTIHVGRIEDVLPPLAGSVAGVTARALAPLPRILEWSRECLASGAVGAYLRGEEWRDELTAVEALSSFNIQTIASRTNPRARLVVVANRSSA